MMAINPGTRIGPYEIVSALGAGGMGEVYRARDTKLDRDVALKILPESFACDPDRLMRFEREAKTLAALNHPNIAAIYGMSSEVISGGARAEITSELIPIQALVMELVEGEDLSALVGGLETEAVLRVAAQIAEALEAAHEAGIIHRDLKPANIKVKADGTVKVLDFGLAKALSTVHVAPSTALGAPSTEHSALTMTSPAQTQIGVILGTAAYMSPEQAKGRPVDRRADVWAFGCVLYEMLTGRRAFGGASVTETIASVIKDAPDFTALPAGTPLAIHRLLRRCLEKDPAKRLDSMHVVGLDLAEVGDGEITGVAAMPRRPRWQLALIAVAGAAAVAAVTWVMKPAPQATALVTRFEVEPPSGPVSSVVISPDGQRVAWLAPERAGGPERIFIRRLDEFEARVLDTGGGSHSSLKFSPDSQELAFLYDPAPGDRAGENSSKEIRKIAVNGGQSTRVCRVDDEMVLSLAWSDGTIYFAGVGGIQAVRDSGGTPRTILTGDDSSLMTRLSLINDGRDVLFSYTTDFKTWSLRTVSATGGNSRTVMDQVLRYIVSPTGHLIYTTADDSVLMARQFLEDRVEAVGDAVPLNDLGVTNTAFAVSEAGTLVSIAQGPQRMESVWIDRSTGRIDPIPEVTTPYGSVRLSASGRYVLFSPPPTRLGTGTDAWVWDSQDRSRVQLTFEGDGSPIGWSWQGDTAFLGTGVLAGTRRFLQATPPWSSAPSPLGAAVKGVIRDVSPDGRQVLAASEGGVALANIDGSGAPALIEPRSTVGFAGFSPDGRLVVYVTRDTREAELWLRPLPEMTARRSRLGSVAPFEPVFWSRSDGALVFFTGERWVWRTVRTGAPGAGPAIGPEVPLDVPDGIQLRGATPDGQRWLGVRPIDSGLPKISVVLNFTEELRAKVPVK